MHHPEVGSGARAAEFLELVGRFSEPAQRQELAVALARLLGGESLLLFAPDPELEVLLPAPGFPQVLEDAGSWREFLGRCGRDGACEGEVPGPDGVPIQVRACALDDGTAAVLLDPEPGPAGPAPLRPLLPLLGALFRAERLIASHEVRARSAAEAVERSKALTRSLGQMRQRLEDALVEANAARNEARERALQAEELSVELQAQADQLQDQALALEELNHELELRSGEAERARAAADEANRAKSEFLANMSHELRTPINAVIGYADLLNMGITGPVTPEQQKQLERIRASSAHLLTLVNDVLDLAKVEAGRMIVAHEAEPVADAVAEAIALIEGQADARQLVLVNSCLDSRLPYVGDRDRVRQILVNLLSNAVKFTERGGRITVEGGTAEGDDVFAGAAGAGPWRFVTVQDTGIGMTADELREIFRPFVQAESGHTRQRGGTGLGLTISRQFARLMGGDLTVKSEKGRGSCFTLWLPATAPEPGMPAALNRRGTSDAAASFPAGLAEAGAILRAEAHAITAAFARRARTELTTPGTPMHEVEILDHAPLFIADLARIFSNLGKFGGDPALLLEGSPLQRLIADEHGAERGRRGWTSEALRRELDLLRDEVISALRIAAPDSGGLDVEGIVRVVDRLIAATRHASLRSLAAVLVVSIPPKA